MVLIDLACSVFRHGLRRYLAGLHERFYFVWRDVSSLNMDCNVKPPSIIRLEHYSRRIGFNKTLRF
jgi:hypothetical protein